jgi:hypothetical protein
MAQRPLYRPNPAPLRHAVLGGARVSLPIPSTATTTIRISLASASTPGTRTAHQIQVRAQTTTSAAASIQAQLYEGATARSALLTTAVSNTLTTYTLDIADSDAATITSYTNLVVRMSVVLC